MNNKNSGVLLQSPLNRKDWEMVKLGEVLSFIGGYAFQKETYNNYGQYRILTIKNVQDGWFSNEDMSRISRLPDNISKDCILSIGDLLISLTGNVGRVCFVTENGCLLNQRVAKIKTKNNVLDKFLFYVLKTESVQEHMKALSVSAAQANLSPIKAEKTIEIPLPPLAIQQKIADSLIAIDDQITALQRLIKKQEAIKKATLKLLLTPKKDWQPVSLGEVATEIKERISVSNISLETYISTENLLQNVGGVEIATSVPSEGSCIAYQKGDILISNIRPYLKKIFLSPYNGGCSNDVIVYRANGEVISEFLFQILSDDSFFEYVMSNATGTKMPRGDRNMIPLYEFSIPPLPIQQQIAESLTSIDEHLEALEAKLKKVESLKAGMMRYFFG